MMSFYERGAEDSAAARKNAGTSVSNAIFYDWRTEDSAAGRKNAEPSGRNAAFE